MNFTEMVQDQNINLRRTSEGYLVATPRVARTGIQNYLPSEVGSDLNRQVRVWRPESEVFSEPTIKSFAHRPITLGHPSSGEMVSADNWKELSVGHSVDPVTRDGEFVRVPVMLMDKAAIQAFESGTAQLSCGYSCDYDPTPGVCDDGPYDAVQRRIKVNHISLVPSARGGDKLKLGDNVTQIEEFNHIRQDGSPLPPRTLHGQTVDYFTGKPIGNNDSEIATRVANPVQDAENIRASAWDAYRQSLDTANNLNDFVPPSAARQRGNPYHDPQTGEFTSGPSSASGGGTGGRGQPPNLGEPDFFAREPDHPPLPHSGFAPPPQPPAPSLSPTPSTIQPFFDPRRQAEVLTRETKFESEQRVFPSKEAALSHASQTAAQLQLHKTRHQEAIKEIETHIKKWQKPKVSSHTKQGPRSLTSPFGGPKSYHYSVHVDGTSVDPLSQQGAGQPQEEFTTMDAQQARDEYLKSITNGWLENKPREIQAQHQAFGDAETERQRAIADMSEAWLRKPARPPKTNVYNNQNDVNVGSAPTGDAAAQAYAQYCSDLENAWRRRA